MKTAHEQLWILGLVCLLFLSSAAPVQGRKHTGRRKTKPVPQRPQKELLLGEVTIYGESTARRVPHAKVVPQEPPVAPPLLGWQPFRLVPPTELQSPQTPRLLYPQKRQVAQFVLKSGTARTGAGGLLFWKTSGIWQIGLSGSWNNTLGTHANRFRHQGQTHFQAQIHFSPKWTGALLLDFLQNSFGFGTGFSSAFSADKRLYPDWRKTRTLRTRVSLQRTSDSADFWQLSYTGQSFPARSETDFRYGASPQTFLTQEKTHCLDFRSRFTRQLNFSVNAKAVLNTDRFLRVPQKTPADWLGKNTQTFVRAEALLSKRLTPLFFARAGFRTFFFKATGQTAVAANPHFLKAAPVVQFLYAPSLRLRFSASYGANSLFWSHLDAFQANPFFRQDIALNQLEFQKSQAQVGMSWEPTAHVVLGAELSDTVIENYPAWVTEYFVGSSSSPTSLSLLSPGLYARTYLPSVHFNAVTFRTTLGQIDGKFFDLRLTSCFNKTSTLDKANGFQHNVPKDIPELPNIDLSVVAAWPLSSKIRVEAHSLYKSARLVEVFTDQPLIVPPYLSEYFLLNTRLTYQLPVGSLFLGIWNLFDQPIEEFYGMWADGRKFFVGTTLTF